MGRHLVSDHLELRAGVGGLDDLVRVEAHRVAEGLALPTVTMSLTSQKQEDGAHACFGGISRNSCTFRWRGGGLGR